jgi:hypothetical protein
MPASSGECGIQAPGRFSQAVAGVILVTSSDGRAMAMANGTTEPKRGATGSWWTTLQGVLTGVAALLTAVGGLVVALQQTGLLPFSSRPSPTPVNHSEPAPLPVSPPDPVNPSSGASGRVEGVGIKILDARRVSEGGATFVELHYRVTNGSEFRPHDPARFVKLVSDGRTLTPTLVPAKEPALPLNGDQDFSVRFRSPPELSPSVVFRFGEEHHLDLSAPVVK